MTRHRSTVCAGRCIRAAASPALSVCTVKSARDQARIGQLLLDRGVYQGREVVSHEWVQRMHEPCAVAPFYGWLTWLNRDGRLFADASRSSWFMFGAGGHTVWIDPDNEAVVVARWLDGAHSAGFVRRVAQALKS
jgi:CubicO group peptidase (beta-lactamase class C family)